MKKKSANVVIEEVCMVFKRACVIIVTSLDSSIVEEEGTIAVTYFTNWPSSSDAFRFTTISLTYLPLTSVTSMILSAGDSAR